MRRATIAACLFVLFFAAALGAEEIKGIVTLPPAGDAASAESRKSTGVVVWVEQVKEVKVPEKRPSISQKDAQFAPRLLVVVAGQTVDFPNDDNIAHNVFSMSPLAKFNLGIYPKGESREVRFEKPGIIDIFCSLHRHMHAKIVVVPNQYYATAKPGEPFVIKDIPPGAYKLTAWCDGHKQATMEVSVTAGTPATADFVLETDAKSHASAGDK